MIGSARNQFLLKALLALAILWLVILGIAKWAGSLRPTPEKILKYAEKNSLSEIEDSDQRREVIGNMADMLNQLEPSDLQELEREKKYRGARIDFFKELDPEEQRYFMEKRIGKAFTQMMQAFNEMDRGERKSMVERTLRRMKDNPGRGPAGERIEDADREMVEKIANAGLKSYYQDASAEAKLDLAPLLEEMQNVMGTYRGKTRRKKN